MNPESIQNPIESTPWDNMLKNVGEWEGSFTQFDLNGTELSNIPSTKPNSSLNATPPNTQNP
jgi:hypothetical protein